MVNFNEDLFDTWESACKQISEFSGVSFGDTQNKKVVHSMIVSDVLFKISDKYSDIIINLAYAENGFSMINESNTIVVDKTGSNFENNFNEVIFNGLLEFIKRYKFVKHEC